MFKDTDNMTDQPFFFFFLDSTARKNALNNLYKKQYLPHIVRIIRVYTPSQISPLTHQLSAPQSLWREGSSLQGPLQLNDDDVYLE
jgi:hypothetical protein